MNIYVRAVGRRVSPRGSRVVGCNKRMNISVVRWVFILDWSGVLPVLSESQ